MAPRLREAFADNAVIQYFNEKSEYQFYARDDFADLVKKYLSKAVGLIKSAGY